jgi:hypothetical protein
MQTFYDVLIVLGGVLSLYVSISVISLNIKAGETNKLIKEIRDILIKTINQPETNSEGKDGSGLDEDKLQNLIEILRNSK